MRSRPAPRRSGQPLHDFDAQVNLDISTKLAEFPVWPFEQRIHIAVGQLAGCKGSLGFFRSVGRGKPRNR